MLQQLIAEAENKPVVYSDDLSSTTRQQQHLQGVKACQDDDVQYLNWLSNKTFNCSLQLSNNFYYCSCFSERASVAEGLRDQRLRDFECRQSGNTPEDT